MADPQLTPSAVRNWWPIILTMTLLVGSWTKMEFAIADINTKIAEIQTVAASERTRVEQLRIDSALSGADRSDLHEDLMVLRNEQSAGFLRLESLIKESK